MSRLERALGAAFINPEAVLLARDLNRCFLQQRSNARLRGIEWHLTFCEWRDWWLASGHLHERGRHRGEWVMARPGDVGAYTLGNIQCMRAEDNVKERNVRRCVPRDMNELEEWQ